MSVEQRLLTAFLLGPPPDSFLFLGHASHRVPLYIERTVAEYILRVARDARAKLEDDPHISAFTRTDCDILTKSFAVFTRLIAKCPITEADETLIKSIPASLLAIATHHSQKQGLLQESCKTTEKELEDYKLKFRCHVLGRDYRWLAAQYNNFSGASAPSDLPASVASLDERRALAKIMPELKADVDQAAMLGTSFKTASHLKKPEAQALLENRVKIFREAEKNAADLSRDLQLCAHSLTRMLAPRLHTAKLYEWPGLKHSV